MTLDVQDHAVFYNPETRRIVVDMSYAARSNGIKHWDDRGIVRVVNSSTGNQVNFSWDHRKSMGALEDRDNDVLIYTPINAPRGHRDLELHFLND